MLKKSISVVLALCAVLCCLIPAFAEEDTGVVSVKLNSNVAGFTENDVEKFIEIKSGNVVYGNGPAGALFIADYSGTTEQGELKAGRTYTVYYMLSPAEGFVVPEELNDDNLKIECDKGVRVITSQITVGNYRDENGEMHPKKGIRIFAELKVDGNVFQNIFGRIYDIIIKMRAWSLY